MRARKGLIACRCLNGEDFGLHAYKALLRRGASAGKLLGCMPMTGLTAEGASVRRAFGSGRSGVLLKDVRVRERWWPNISTGHDSGNQVGR